MTEASETSEVLPYHQRLDEFVRENVEDRLISAEEFLNICKEFQEDEKMKKRKDFESMPCGKYKFKKVKDVVSFDEKYCEWFLKQDFSKSYPECRKLMKECMTK